MLIGAHGGQRRDRAAGGLRVAALRWNRRRSAARPATTPMHPQFTAWQDAPHSQVACVAMPHRRRRPRVRPLQDERHAAARITSSTGRLPTADPGVSPICVRRMEVCGTCHWSGKDFGDVVRVKREYADDEANTETSTFLQMLVGGPGAPARSGRAIHWHADPACKSNSSSPTRSPDHPVRQVTDAKGRCASTPPTARRREQLAKGSRRTMDCVDCHNVVAHRVAATPEQAVDRGASRRANQTAGSPSSGAKAYG